jgi:hypothetical protein
MLRRARLGISKYTASCSPNRESLLPAYIKEAPVLAQGAAQPYQALTLWPTGVWDKIPVTLKMIFDIAETL